MARGTSLFQAVRRTTAKVFSRQRLEELIRPQGEWRNEVCMQVTMLTTQSQTIKKLIVDRSFLWMVSPAQRLIAKVTVVIEMFAKTKLLSGVAFTWRLVCVLL